VARSELSDSAGVGVTWVSPSCSSSPCRGTSFPVAADADPSRSSSRRRTRPPESTWPSPTTPVSSPPKHSLLHIQDEGGQTLTPAFLVNADVEPIKSVPVAIFKGTEDAMMDEKALDEVEEILKKNLSADKLLVQRFPGA